MACSCQKKKGVQVKASNGRSVYTSTSVASAAAVAKRYPGSAIWQDGKQIDPETLQPMPDASAAAPDAAAATAPPATT